MANKLDTEFAIKKWEKDFEHQMSSNERTMFTWGYTAAINTLIKSMGDALVSGDEQNE